MDWSFLSPKYVQYTILIVTVLSLSFIAIKIIRKVIIRLLAISTKKLQVDPTNYRFLANGSAFIVLLTAFIIIFNSIPELKQLGVTLFAGAGIITVVVGFASQQAFSNIVSGIFIVIFKPFRVYDIVEIGTNIGKVEDITLRHTVINSFENKRIIFPNSVISTEVITNWSINESKVCQFVHFGISYDSDIDLARSIIQDEAMKHSSFVDNRNKADKTAKINPVTVRVIGHGDSSIDLRAYIWAKDPEKGFHLKYDILEAVKKRFDKEGITIPFPHRVIIQKNEKK